jgi:hypothetical protein
MIKKIIQVLTSSLSASPVKFFVTVASVAYKARYTRKWETANILLKAYSGKMILHMT